MVIEPRMTGLMLLSDPPDRDHLRVEWRLAGSAEYRSLWFWDRRGLGTVRLFGPGELDRHFRGGTVGPDALEMTVENWQRSCAATSRAIKIVLLDQRTVAGIGNLYASEILHLSRIHPARPADRLKPAEISRLHDAVLVVLEEAIRDEGSTLSDATYRNGAQSKWPLSKQTSRVRPRGSALHHVLDGSNPPHCPSPTFDVFLPRVPEEGPAVRDQGSLNASRFSPFWPTLTPDSYPLIPFSCSLRRTARNGVVRVWSGHVVPNRQAFAG